MDEKITAKDYFDTLKEAKNKNTDEALDKFYDSALLLMNKYNKTGQKLALEKILYILQVIPKERELIKLGIDSFVYKSDINDFINKVENKDVKIIELENFPRDIPDEILPVIDSVRDVFDKLYVVFTDYTGEIERKIEKERREKDPILFGAFIDKRNELYERFYYLADWEDEYCDLTLEKLIEVKGEDVVKTISTPITKEELVAEYHRLTDKKSDSNNFMISNNVYTTTEVVKINSSTDQNRSKDIVKPTVFNKIKSIFNKKGK